MTTETLTTGAHNFGIDLTSEQLDTFETYYSNLVVWNERINLTTIIERDQVIVKHFLDSLSIAQVLHLAGSSCHANLIDVGAGAGFPGLPLKIVFPDLGLTLLDATGKKVEFLKHIIVQLKLDNTIAIQARAEDLGHHPNHRECYDFAVARAVADLATLLEYALPLVRIRGIFVAQKGVQVEEEINQASHALTTLGGRIHQVLPVHLPGLEPRHLIVVEKIAATPNLYPRRAGIPARKPLSS